MESYDTNKLQDQVVEYMVEGLCLQKDWCTKFGQVYWYEKIIFGNGGMLLYKYPYGIGAYSANSLEDYNRVLKGIEKNHTFCGTPLHSVNVPIVGKDIEYPPFDYIKTFTTIIPETAEVLFPNVERIVPLSKEFIEKCKEELTDANTSAEKRIGKSTHYYDFEDQRKVILTESVSERIARLIPEDEITKIKSEGRHKKGKCVDPNSIKRNLSLSETQVLLKLLEYYFVRIIAHIMYPPKPKRTKSNPSRRHKSKSKGFLRISVKKDKSGLGRI